MNPWPGQKRSTFHTLMCSEVAWRLCLLHCQHSVSTLTAVLIASSTLCPVHLALLVVQAISWPQSTPNWLHDFTSFATLHCVCINNNLSGTASVICIIRKNRKIPACVSPTGTSTPSVGHCRTCLDFATASGKRIRCGPAYSTAKHSFLSFFKPHVSSPCGGEDRLARLRLAEAALEALTNGANRVLCQHVLCRI